VVPGGDPADDPAHQPGEDVVKDGNALGARTPGGGRTEAVGAALGEGGRQVLLMLAEYVDADVVGRRDRRPAGGSGADAEGQQWRFGGDGGERGGSEADRAGVASRSDHGDPCRMPPEDGTQQIGRGELRGTGAE